MKQLLFTAIVATVLCAVLGAPQITVTNQCGYDVWVAQLANGGSSVIPGQGVDGAGKLGSGGTATYTIPDPGWGGRFWPKTGCDANGANCEAGSSSDGCPSDGCEPPADTKVEFFYYPLSDTTDTPYYDISLVDGYSLPIKITPDNSGGNCVETVCGVSMDSCPQNEIDGLGDLRVMKNGKYVMCLSPCKKWNYPAPYGMGQPEDVDPGLHMCCPTPPVSSDDCRAGPVTTTQYVNLIHQACPSAYSYAYDDVNGLHACPAGTSFHVTFCP